MYENVFLAYAVVILLIGAIAVVSDFDDDYNSVS